MSLEAFLGISLVTLGNSGCTPGQFHFLSHGDGAFRRQRLVDVLGTSGGPSVLQTNQKGGTSPMDSLIYGADYFACRS